MFFDNNNLLIGMNNFFVHPNNTGIGNIYSQLGFSPSWTNKPCVLDQSPTAPTAVLYNPREFPRSETQVNLLDDKTATQELTQNHMFKSVMSLDGIFSPISFYPTPYNTTFHITKYPTPYCPFCFGTKSYSYKKEYLTGPLNVNGINEYVAATQTTVTIPSGAASGGCPFCEPLAKKLDKTYIGILPREIVPPHIITSGTDLNLLVSLANGRSGISGLTIINYTTLTPIVLSGTGGVGYGGEFSVFQNKQSGDFAGHSISCVSFGACLPGGTSGTNDGLRTHSSKRIERSYSDYDLNLADWFNNLRGQGVNIPTRPPIYNNMRFFGLRGPIMVHGWGYDTEGFPVPNASGEPLISGTPPKIMFDADGNMLGKNQKPEIRNGVSCWSKPYKENKFYKGWAQQPGTWPVGPVDLRWDSDAMVWTIGGNYKMVHVMMEEDLVGDEPARAQILENTASTNPLPSGFRRLIYVKDFTGMYPAPRGAGLYCKYNAENGFYEPLGTRHFVTSGEIVSANTVKIYKIYTKPGVPNIRLSDDPNVTQYQTIFKNPLNYSVAIGTKGLFTFIDGYWSLSSYNPQ